jgi:hypothetical protein
VVLLLGLLVSLIILLPQVRQFILSMIEQLVLHRKFQQPQKWMEELFKYALASSGFMILLSFFLLTLPGRKLVNKSESKDETNNRIYFNTDILREIIFSEKFFAGFALISGFIMFSIAFFRATNTGITYDEASTYINYVLPNVFDSLSKNQSLNNHFLNSFCIRVIMFFSQSKCNELLIRFPNLVFYCIYFIFSYLIAKQYKNLFFIFTLFISNYYLNEFFGLARGYGMACACIAGICYFFEKWKSVYKSNKTDSLYFYLFLFFCFLAALSNSITLYIIFCFLVLINFKYKKDLFKLSYFPFFIIFFLAALHSVMFSNRGGESVYSTHSIYSSIMSIPNMFSNSKYLTFLIALLFLLSFIYLMKKTRAKDDYCWILVIFTVICIVSQLVFHRGYPVAREMIPFYPISVIIIANALKHTPNWKMAKPAFVVCTYVLCFQFFLKIDTKSTRDWNDNYLIRNIVYSYIASHDIFAGREEFLSFIKTSQELQHNNPAFTFYAEKAEFFLRNRTEE